MICARVHLEGGGTYTQSMSDLNVLLDEISEAAKCESVGAKWTVELIEMTPEAYEALGDFEGH